MRLLTPDHFAHVFHPLQGRRIGYVRPQGNVGDALIEWAMHQLFDHFAIQWKLVTADDALQDVDELVFGGGGNMGTLWEGNWRLRARCLERGKPLTVLPQSFTSPEDRPFKRVYVRERASLRLYPQGILAPDLALGLNPPPVAPPTRRLGIFLRRDSERAVAQRWLARDPVRRCRSPQQYLQLAGRYDRIVTDRLHFAICGLLLRRHTTLLPNAYHKNASMFETWLRDLGCHFATSVPEALGRAAA